MSKAHIRVLFKFSVLLTGFFLAAHPCAAAAAGPDSRPQPPRSALVSGSEGISDFKARLMLVDLLLQTKDPVHLARTGAMVDKLAADHPDNSEVKIFRIRRESALGNRARAIFLAEEFLASADFDPKAFLTIADLFASFGQHSKCRDIYLEVIEKSDNDKKETLLLDFADRTILWGDFYTAEKIIRKQLEKDPSKKQLHLKLGRNLAAQQRYDEARKHLQFVIRQSHEGQSALYYEAWAQRVNIGLQESDYAKAAAITDSFIASYGPRDIILVPGARAYYRNNRMDEAETLYLKALDADGQNIAVLTGLGQVKAGQEKDDQAADCWERALAIEPDAPLAKIFLLRATEDSLPGYVAGVIGSNPGPDRLSDLGNALAMQGYRELAVSCYEAVFQRYPDYFPAGMGLAETYGAAGRNHKSIAVLDKLIDEYPQSHKLALTRARVLAWSAEYRDAVAAYEAIYQKNPQNPVVLKEAARAAYWGKMADMGDDYYQRIYTPGVDELLLARMGAIDSAARDPLLENEYEKLAGHVSNRSVYTGYEKFFSWYEKQGHRLRPHQQEWIEKAEYELNYLYLIHKKAFLERQSKNLAYNRRFAPARRWLQKLTALDPGNQEALFEQAQSACALGLCDQERQTYEKLLAVDSLHGQAAAALERQQTRSSPRVFGKYNLWREEGRGDLSQMVRHRGDLSIEVPVICRHKLKLTTHRYFESPIKYGNRVEASGLSVEGELVTGPYVSFSGGITRKFYNGDLTIRDFSELAPANASRDSFRVDLSDMTLGYANLVINLDNYARLWLGYEKQEEVANAVALAQGIYSERTRTRLDIYPARRIDLGVKAEYATYSDNNQGYIYGADAGYAFTDHPRQVKGIVSVEYRNTSDTYQACADTGDSCSITDDFKHPYWTPENYWKTDVTLAFRHDLAGNNFCGARPHFYDLRLILGMEQDQNPFVEIAALWQKEIKDRMGISASAMWHTSSEWDAAALALGLFFRF